MGPFYNLIPFLWDPFYYYPPNYACVSHVISSLQFFWLKFCMHFSSHVFRVPCSCLFISFIRSLFNDAFSVTKISVRWKDDAWIMNWKGYGRKWSCTNLRHYPGICLERLRKTTKILSQDSRSLGQDLNPGPPEYEPGVLITWSQQCCPFVSSPLVIALKWIIYTRSKQDTSF
jgi:hypothetical protein